MAYRNNKIVWENPILTSVDCFYFDGCNHIEAEIFNSFCDVSLLQMEEAKKGFNDLTKGGVTKKEAGILLKRLRECCNSDDCWCCKEIRKVSTAIINLRTRKYK